MSPKRCSRPLPWGASSAPQRGGAADSRPRSSIHIVPSYTTCAAPAQNGERSTRRMLGSQVNSGLREYQRVGNGRGTMKRKMQTMTSTQYATNMARAFMAAEMVMAAVNCGASIDARARAERVLDDYFALVEQAVTWTEYNPLDRRS